MRHNICAITFRLQGRVFLNPALNNETKNWCQRTDTVNIQITFIAWILEFTWSCVLLAARICVDEGYDDHVKWIRLFDICVTFVFLPCAYILNREITKQKIVWGNWYQGIKSIFITGGQVMPTHGDDVVPEPPPEPSTDEVVHNQSAEVDRRAASCSRHTESSGVISIPSHTPPASLSQIIITLTNQDNSNNRLDLGPDIKVVPLSNVRVIHVASADIMNIYNNE